MKKVELKVTQDDEGKVFDYRKLLTDNLKVKREGMDIPEMIQALRVLNQIKQANGAVLLEEADYSYIVERMKTVRWVLADSALVAFYADLEHAPTVDPNELLKDNGH